MAEIVAVAVVDTDVVVTVKVAVVAPARTVTLAGTVALALSEVRLTTIPPGPAAPVRVTVPVEEFPPTNVVGERAMLVSVAALTVSVAVCVAPLSVPVIVTVAVVDTAVVVTAKVALVAPAGTLTEAGTVAQALLDDKVTLVPPGPAGPVRVTVPVDGLPPISVEGERVILVSPAGLIVRLAVNVVDPSVAEIVAVAAVDTADVVILKVADVVPAATVTVAGTTPFALELDKLIVVPPDGADPLMKTVPVKDVPPVTV